MCTIVDTDDSRVKVHYDGFDPVYDEWVDKLSSRIKPAEGARPASAPVTAAAETAAAAASPSPAKNSKVLVLSKSNTWRMCTIVDTDDSRVKVHYDGYDEMYDEWVDKLSSRIKPAEGAGPAPAPVEAAAEASAVEAEAEVEAESAAVKAEASAAAETPAAAAPTAWPVPVLEARFTRAEVASHCHAKDCWVSIFSKVYDLSGLLERSEQSNEQEILRQPIIDAAGTDISHWFNEASRSVKTKAHPSSGLQIPESRFLHVAPAEPRADWRNDFGTPWWLDDSFCIGWLEGQSEIVRFGKGQWGHSEADAVIAQAFQGSTVVQICCGEKHCLAVLSNGDVYSWGSGAYGCLGHGDTNELQVPTQIAALNGKKVVQACCGEAHCLVVLDSGDVYSWGSGLHGCLGHGDVNEIAGVQIDNETGVPYLPVPTQIAALKGQRARCVCGGTSHSLAVLTDGTIYSWGSTMYGCLGQGAEEEIEGLLKGEDGVQYLPMPTQIVALEKKHVVSACCGEALSMAVTSDGALYSWGSDDCGGLGAWWSDGSHYTLQQDQNGELYSPTPLLVQGLRGKKVVQVCCGDAHNLAVLDSGDVYSWGSSLHGCLGHGDVNEIAGVKKDENGESYLPVPTQIAALNGKKVVQTCCGEAHNLAMLDSGDVYSWGSGLHGCLGHSEEEMAQLLSDDGGVPILPMPAPL
eukprot:g2059.t1